MTKRITIVTHCYCPPGLDVYAEHLRHQWASLVRYKGEPQVKLCVFFSTLDKSTRDTLVDLQQLEPPAGLTLVPFALGQSELFRRAIGRNLITKQDRTADVFWFTDVDYLFGPECLNAVARLVGPDDLLCQPAMVNISKSHQIGQRVVDEYRGVPLPDIAFETFVPRRQTMCIGGVQIVGGNTARRIGYCEGTKWVRPVDPAAGFRSCKCDKAFRRINKLSAARLHIPNVFRLRHTEAGRDRDAAGEKKGRLVW